MENRQLINRSVRYIMEHLHDTIALADIAEYAGFSLSYFDALFEKHTGYNVMEYVRVFRLSRAAIALRSTDKTILEIALDHQYANPENFCRAFKAFYGLAPSEYRAKYAGVALSWSDLSGKTLLNQFKHCFAALQPVDMDSALDYMFLHNKLGYLSTMSELLITDNAILSLDDSQEMHGFIYAMDFARDEYCLGVAAEDEAQALRYLGLIARLESYRVGFVVPADAEWSALRRALQALSSRVTLYQDYMYLSTRVPPGAAEWSTRLFTETDLEAVRCFRSQGGCTDAHVKGLEGYFGGYANAGLLPFGVYAGDKLIGLILPAVQQIRDVSLCDLGELLLLPGYRNADVFPCIQNHMVDYCTQHGYLPVNLRVPLDESAQTAAWGRNARVIAQYLSAKV